MRKRIFLFGLLVSLLGAREVLGRGSTKTWVEATSTTPSCTLDVVLVTFKDTTGTSSTEVQLDYDDHDRPYGYTALGSPSTSSSYTLSDFERLFNGGYGTVADFVGKNQTVANGNTTLPAVFGSVRAYYDSMSLDPKDRPLETHGKFQLHAQLINADDGNGYPRWIQLPHTKEYYHEIDYDDHDFGNIFWDDAYAAAADAVSCWRSGTRASDGETCGSISGYAIELEDLPNDDFSRDRRIRHKVVYLYSGAMYTGKQFRVNNRNNNTNHHGLLHPQADKTTEDDPTSDQDVGYRYVMAERQGWGHTDHDIDAFSGIGIHVHEIGHLLGLIHGGGRWTGQHPNRGTSSYTSTRAHLLGWGVMTGGGEQGPLVRDTSNSDHGSTGLRTAYRSCPNPLNPFYRLDLGWIAPVAITQDAVGYALAPGSVHQIHAEDGLSYLLERRPNSHFGRYVSFYEYANADAGLLIWRRGHREIPLLIVADERRIADARADDDDTTIPDYQDMLSDPFPGTDNVAQVDARTAAQGLRQTSDSMPDPGNLGFALTDIRRRGEVGNDTLSLDVQLNYWAGSLDVGVQEVWGDGVPKWDVDPVYVIGDVTIPEGTTLTIASDTVVLLTGNSDVMGTGNATTRSELLVHGDLIAEGVTFRPADEARWGGLVFYGDATNHATSSVLTGCTLDSAATGVHVETVGWTLGGDPEKPNQIQNCEKGIVIQGSSSKAANNVVRNNTVASCEKGILVQQSPGNTLQQNLITGSTEFGIRIFGQKSKDNLIVNNTLRSTAGEGVSFSTQTSGTVRNTIASGFSAGGLVGRKHDSIPALNANVTVDYYLGHNNGANDLKGTTAGTRRALLSDPKFVDPDNGGFTLQSGSPALDLGVATMTDPDGSRIDLGRYGGTSQAATARGRLEIEDYFYEGNADGWMKASGTAGTWAGVAGAGTYQVSGATGTTRAYRSVDAANYVVETRLKFSGASGKVIYLQADQSQWFRVDLITSDTVRLLVNNVPHDHSFTIDSDVWYAVRVEVRDKTVSVWVNGAPTHTAVALGTLPDGVVGVGSYDAGSHTAELDYFLVLDASPATPANLIANPLNGQVELCWNDPGDATITGYAYRDSVDGAAWSGWTTMAGSGAGTIGYTVPDLTNGTLYTFQVRGLNGAGAGPAAQIAAMPANTLDSNTDPWFAEGSAARTVMENSPAATPVGAAVTALDKGQNDVLSYALTSMSGSTLFDIGTGSGQITVSSSAKPATLNHEVDPLHTVTVGVSDGLDAAGEPDAAVDATISVNIRVSDVDEPPPAPTDVQVTAPATDGHERLEVSWTAPDHYGPPVDSSRVEYCEPSQADLDLDDLYDPDSPSLCTQGSSSFEKITGTATSTTLSGLKSGTLYWVRVRAFNAEGSGRWSPRAKGSTALRPLTVTYGSATYQATEGGNVTVYVGLSPAADRTVSIPISETGVGTEAGDYTVAGLTEGKLSFARGTSSQSFTITANEDADGADEMVTLGLGTPLPSGVSAGTPASTTVTLVDQVAVPDVPGNLTAAAGNTQVVLRWETPNNNGAAISGYDYRQKTTGAYGSWGSISGSDANTTSHTVTSLSNGIEYTFQVRAENRLGDGAASNEVSATPAAVPDAPGNLSATGGSAQVALRWTTPGSNGAAISGYDYRQKTTGAYGSWGSISGSDANTTSHTVTSLSNGIEHTFQVRAVNSVGDGAASNEVSATPAAVPDAPGNLSATGGSAQVALRWTTPGSNGAAISGYDYRQKTTGAYGSWGSISGSDANTTSHTVTSLSNGIEHTFQVRAVNSVGDGAASNEVSATPAAVPDAPGNLSATGGSAQVALRWTTPGSNGAAISGYDYRSTPPPPSGFYPPYPSLFRL